MLDSLYQEIILDHYRNPRNFGSIENPQVIARFDNPSCGDEIEVQVVLNDAQCVCEIKFQGRGCAISQASASMMTEAIQGKHVDEVKTLIEGFQGFMMGQDCLEDDFDDLEALEGVRKFPVRIKCATLAWTALSHILKEVKAKE